MQIARKSNEHDRMTVALLLPDGVGSRNFLMGPFRGQAKDRLSLTVLSAMPESVRAIYENEGAEPLAWAKYDEYRDKASLFMLRNIVTYAHMYSIETFGMQCVRSLPRRGKSKRRIAAEAARWLGRGAAKVDGLGWLDRRLAALVENLPETARCRALFERIRPAVLLSSNQRPTASSRRSLPPAHLGFPRPPVSSVGTT